MVSRGQIYTIEAITAAVIILGAVVFALEATAVTPLTASTANQQIEEQQRTMAGDVLDTAYSEGMLTDDPYGALLYWDTASDQFAHPDNPRDNTFYNYRHAGPKYEDGGTVYDTPFGSLLRNRFVSNDIAFNIYLDYPGTSGAPQCLGGPPSGPQCLVYQGDPSNNAVSASRSVVLFNDTELTGGPDAGTELQALYSPANDSTSFYAPPVSPMPQYSSTNVYTVVEVRIVAWRI
jgi:hypothetical protein